MEQLKRNKNSIKQISFDSVTPKQQPLLRVLLTSCTVFSRVSRSTETVVVFMVICACGPVLTWEIPAFVVFYEFNNNIS